MSDSVKSNIESLCESLGDFVSTKTVVGDAITIGDIVLLPLIEVSFGMAAGGSENKDKGTGGGLGAKITPSAVLAVINGNVQLINIKNQDAVNKLIDMAPGVVDKLNFGSIFGKRKDEVNNDNKVVFEEEKISE
jgi:uncharacterized spore protein YtfJ